MKNWYYFSKIEWWLCLCIRPVCFERYLVTGIRNSATGTLQKLPVKAELYLCSLLMPFLTRKTTLLCRFLWQRNWKGSFASPAQLFIGPHRVYVAQCKIDLWKAEKAKGGVVFKMTLVHSSCHTEWHFAESSSKIIRKMTF